MNPANLGALPLISNDTSLLQNLDLVAVGALVVFALICLGFVPLLLRRHNRRAAFLVALIVYPSLAALCLLVFMPRPATLTSFVQVVVLSIPILLFSAVPILLTRWNRKAAFASGALIYPIVGLFLSAHAVSDLVTDRFQANRLKSSANGVPVDLVPTRSKQELDPAKINQLLDEAKLKAAFAEATRSAIRFDGTQLGKELVLKPGLIYDVLYQTGKKTVLRIKPGRAAVANYDSTKQNCSDGAVVVTDRSTNANTGQKLFIVSCDGNEAGVVVAVID